MVAALLLALAAAPGWADVLVGPPLEVPDGQIEFLPTADLLPQSGGFAPRIPLEILPALAGFAPDLALVYSAGRSNGPLGAGWGLGFESAIARRSRLGGLPGMAADDTFWLDGQRLVAAGDGTFRTEQDDFTVYTQIRSGTEIVGWKALKDGHARIWGDDGTRPLNDIDDVIPGGTGGLQPAGRTVDGGVLVKIDAQAVEYRDETFRNDSPDGDEPVGWLISADISPFGARISYRYASPEVPDLGRNALRHLPDRITYSTQGGAFNEINFGYEDRGDVRVSRANGPERAEAQRLRRITVRRIDGGTVWTAHHYVFDYDLAEHSPQSLLTGVRALPISDPAARPSESDEAAGLGESIARFAYEDSATAWGAARPIPLRDDPALDVAGADQYFTFPLTADVNGDARPDLIVFNDLCNAKNAGGGGGGGGGGRPVPGDDITVPDGIVEPGLIPHFECTAAHRVYLNTIETTVAVPATPPPAARASNDPVVLNRVHSPALRYDAVLSGQARQFFGPLHDLFLKATSVAAQDLDRDGFAELIRAPHSYARGGPDGWDVDGAETGVSDLFDDLHFADLNGDGFVDLVGQSQWFPNSGAAPFFASTSRIAISDPVTVGGAAPLYDGNRSACLDGGDSGIFLRWDFGVNALGHRSSDPDAQLAMNGDDWVWRNTLHADLNGDGLADRVISVPFLEQESQVESADGFQMWRRNDALCGRFDAVFLGDGRGGFTASGYGIGGPMSREAPVHQTRTFTDGVVDADSDTYAFDYPVNHFAAADFDADGRPEITQFCGGDAFRALWDRGLVPLPGDRPGFGASGHEAACPTRFVATPPETFFGLSLLDYHYATTLDVDGDGMTDLFTYSHPVGDPDIAVSNVGAPWEDWVDGPTWRPNLRGTAQNRLVAITGPRGGETLVTWGWGAADPENAVPVNVEHVETLKDESGLSRFAFSGGAYADGEFLGFGRVETFTPRGATFVQTFFANRFLRGKPSTEELYDTGGRLKSLRVHVPGSDQPTVSTLDGLAIDGWAPYYNPLRRVCEFEFGSFSPRQLGTDLDPFVARCEAFAREAGPVVLDDFPVAGFDPRVARTVSAVLRGRDPRSLAVPPAERRELLALQSLAMGQDPDSACARPQPPAGATQAPAACALLRRSAHDRVAAGALGVFSAARAVDWSAAPDPTHWTIASPAPDLPDGVVLTVETERMYVTEYDYGPETGRIVEQRELRDIDTTRDSLVRRFDHTGWQDALSGAELVGHTVSDLLGTTYEDVAYRDRVNGAWGRLVETDTANGSTRTLRRVFGPAGEVLTETDRIGRTLSWGYGACGVVTRLDQHGGYAEETELDPVCRPVAITRRHGDSVLSVTTIRRDAFGREVERRVVSDPDVPDRGPVMIRRLAHDAAAAADSPSEVVLLPESDGSTTLTKTYRDERDRVIRVVRCTKGGAGGGAGLDGPHPCTTGTESVQETLYDPATGDVAERIGPYRPADAVRPVTRNDHDEFGRLVSTIAADGGETRFSYRLGRRTATDPIGRDITVTFDTLAEDVHVSGIYGGGTRRDAYGRTTTRTDSAAEATAILYDGFNRPREEVGPVVDVLASNAETPVAARPATRFEYDAADRLTARVDPTGARWQFGHDALDRLTSVQGPDGVEVQHGFHTDGGLGTRLSRIRDTRLGVARVEHFDGLGRLRRLVGEDGAETTTDYDAQGRVAQTVLPWGEARSGEDRDGGLTRLETVTQGPLTYTVETVRDAAGRPVSVTDADGQRLDYTYDLMGRLVLSRQGGLETERRTYDAAGRLVRVRALGVTTCFAYDALDRIITEAAGCNADGDGLVTVTRSYTALGQVDVETNGDGGRRDRDHDAAGRLVSVAISAGDGAPLGTTRFAYDAEGKLTERREPLGGTERLAYDLYGRLVRSDPVGADATNIAYSPEAGTWVAVSTGPTGETTVQATDALGRETRRCGPDGVCLESRHAQGRLDATVRFDAGGQLLGTRHRDYHPGSSRLRREWDWLAPGEGGAACAPLPGDACPVPHVEYGYTLAGRPATFRDPQGGETRYHYDTESGSMLLVETERPGRATERLRYDPDFPLVVQRRLEPTDAAPPVVEVIARERNLRPVRILRSSGRGGGGETLSFGYDAAGRRVLATRDRDGSSVTLAQRFDARGLPLGRDLTVVENGTETTASLAFAWREDGRLAQVGYPSGRIASYDYNKTDQQLGTVRLDGAPVWEADAFDAAGRPGSVVLAGGSVAVKRRFDPAGRVAERQMADLAHRTASTEILGYDRAGRLSSVGTTEAGATSVTSFSHDARDRLVGESHAPLDGPRHELDYAYDPLTGARTTKSDAVNGEVTRYTYRPGAQLDSVNGTPIPRDGFGRQTGDQLGRRFVWDLGDQIVAVEEGGKRLESYLHDADGRQAARISAAGLELDLTTPDGAVLARLDAGGSSISDYVRLPGGPVIAVIDRSGAVLPVLPDATGSPHRIGSADGPLMPRDSTAFGEPLVPFGKTDEPLGFHEMLGTLADGLLIAGVRAYDSSAGRFLTADPLGLGAAPSPLDAADGFRYARDNPVIWGDPGGLAPCLQTPEGGCTANIGEQSYEQQRHAAGAHFAANDPQMRALQAQADEYYKLINTAIAMGQELARMASDGRLVEAPQSLAARPPAALEAPGEPVPKAPAPQGAAADPAATGAPKLAEAYGADRVALGAAQNGIAPGLLDALVPDMPEADPYGPFGGDALAEAPTPLEQDLENMFGPIRDELDGTHISKDDWLNRLLGRYKPGPYGVVSVGISAGGGLAVSGFEGIGIYKRVSCAICLWDLPQNWAFYDAQTVKMGNQMGADASIDFGYSRDSAYLGTSRGGGVEAVAGGGGALYFNIDPNHPNPLAGPLSYVNATGWQFSLSLGGGYAYGIHQTQTNKIPYSRIQPYVAPIFQAWQGATGP